MKQLKDFLTGEKIKHKSFGIGRILEIKSIESPVKWVVDFPEHGTKTLLITEEQIEELDTPGSQLTFEDIKNAMREVLEEELPVSNIEMGERWTGGKMVLIPNRDDLKPKEIPLDSFFHKIVMLRERLRVLEQKINNHEMLTDEDRVEFQQYITRIYGSLTTFNIFFKSRDDFFIGQKGK